ncbi:hypothetical protein TNCV_3778991 [Trichonephila clavipes]|nr:hypothetical protein TNCV_3778991 [Trichonephila clavipes]
MKRLSRKKMFQMLSKELHQEKYKATSVSQDAFSPVKKTQTINVSVEHSVATDPNRDSSRLIRLRRALRTRKSSFELFPIPRLSFPLFSINVLMRHNRPRDAKPQETYSIPTYSQTTNYESHGILFHFIKDLSFWPFEGSEHEKKTGGENLKKTGPRARAEVGVIDFGTPTIAGKGR